MRSTFLHNLEMNGRERRRRFRIALPILYVIVWFALQCVGMVLGAGHGHTSAMAESLDYIFALPWSLLMVSGVGAFPIAVLQVFLLGFALDYLISLIPRSR